jgi:hypothetical protein
MLEAETYQVRDVRVTYKHDLIGPAPVDLHRSIRVRNRPQVKTTLGTYPVLSKVYSGSRIHESDTPRIFAGLARSCSIVPSRHTAPAIVWNTPW